MPPSAETLSSVRCSAGPTGFPVKQGLYDPRFESDACGVGMIISIDGIQTRDTMDKASHAVMCMSHRGAEGSEPTSGDGAGIMTGIPHELIGSSVKEAAITLPKPGHYAAGNVFFSHDGLVRMQCKQTFAEIAKQQGLEVLGWRPVPTDPKLANVGPTAMSRQPKIEQALVTYVSENKDENGVDPNQDLVKFERACYLALKIAENRIPYEKHFYVCSLSPRLIVYKGMLTPGQLFPYFCDLRDPGYKTHFALTHTRFSTNTFPSWDRAQPLRHLAHNGEINTLMGNKNWMTAREGDLHSKVVGVDLLSQLYPIISDNTSDSGALDNVIEFMLQTGEYSLPEIMMMVAPEPWEADTMMSEEKKGFYEWASNLMEPWDGPALLSFCDGRYAGAVLDRNGLRPARYWLTTDNYLIMGSETGVVPVQDSLIKEKGRLQPGKMLLVDMEQHTFTRDEVLKHKIVTTHPYARWVEQEKITLKDLLKATTSSMPDVPEFNEQTDPRMRCMGYTLEHLHMLLQPMVENAYEALGSMGNDAPLACLSKQTRLPYEYFKQLFAQVTNPPIDPFREAIIMSLKCPIGPCGNLLVPDQEQCHRIEIETPVITMQELHALKNMSMGLRRLTQWKVATIDLTFDRKHGPVGLQATLRRICEEALRAMDRGYRLLVLSDRQMGPDRVPVSSLIAVGAVHQFLVQKKRRLQVGLVVETAEAREVHHMCVLAGYGADAICPYLVFEAMEQMRRKDMLAKTLTHEQMCANYVKATDTGIRKVMSKMGISTLKSYKGAQVFEAVGLHPDVVQLCFTGTASRIKGVNWDTLSSECLESHGRAWPMHDVLREAVLPDHGDYHFRNSGEGHINDPGAIANLQDAARMNSRDAFKEFSRISNEQVKNCTIRGLFALKSIRKIPIDEVEPAAMIVRRFCTGAMSYGSISKEAHETLAVAMNRIGGKSNTGEGGENPERFQKLPSGDSKRSSIKQVASGRFGVSIHYLTEADEIQIKMAQGAKPGEGGELPAHKVDEKIASCRNSTPFVGLISPPPHHDIYSIEDLAQLIHDLKCANPTARISVKLVSKVGVGVIASGVAKGHAEHITISGHDGGTGAASWTGIKHAGLPWELGLAETHQTLVLNDLRDRVTLQTDGQLRTGRDIVIASLLGADEFAFSTAPLIAMGCIMMRKCHLNTCPVGIATQDPVLRQRFSGAPEHVVNFFFMLAEEVRQIMAGMGFRTMNEMCGRADMLYVDRKALNHKTKDLDLSVLMVPAFELRPGAGTICTRPQDHGLEQRLDNKLIAELCAPSLAHKTPTKVTLPITNVDRDFGTTLSHEICKRYGPQGLPEGTIHINIHGSAGQSLGAFLTHGVTLELKGDANDYVGKGLSGGRIIVYPGDYASGYKSQENVVVGNVCLYGGVSGKAFFRGTTAERFCVRNSGVTAVCEGVGDHGCEYMTGGHCVVLGRTGKNFAAGMSGGVAYVWDKDGTFDTRCNKQIVDLLGVTDRDEQGWLRGIITEFREATMSEVAQEVLSNWSHHLREFVKVLPRDYARAMKQKAERERAGIKGPVEKTPEEIAAMARVPDIEDVVASVKKGAKLDKVRGFKLYPRQQDRYRPPAERVQDFAELQMRPEPERLKVQASRCMDCGIPFCSSQHSGCPISNVIPKFNDFVFKGQMREALQELLLTNNFPEFTGRVCPAPCEGACTLGITSPQVAIKSIECAIIDHAWEQGWMKPREIKYRTNRYVTVIGSGPSGLAAADQLNRAGHTVTVYERTERVGGLLMYGIPNMKLDKSVVQRRVDLMAAEGVQFVTKAEVGVNVDVHLLLRNSHAMILATGATWPRDLPIKGRDLRGIFFAMDFLGSVTDGFPPAYLQTKGKDVIVIGGGDTGNDCIGTSMRQGANSVVSFEIMPKPPGGITEEGKIDGRAPTNPWPQWPKIFRVDYGHEEVRNRDGSDPRQFNTMSKEFVDDGTGGVKGINTVQVQWSQDTAGRWQMVEIPGTEKFYKADIVFLAMGFLGPEKAMIDQLEIRTDPRGNHSTPAGKYHTNVPRVYSCGDCRRGQSLVVWAINEGRQCARQVDYDLMAETQLPLAGGIVRAPEQPPHRPEAVVSRM
eukprot:TRINITY_DN3892_c0_g3_i1.p1 TRINITY_DN3892_c0_g3~~TRINITY_DN3892_c0_g3_i1.p1  ORF type:complete len:2125 (+),score=762.42 TRINITY_DN3892_c0_g3_i1:110-6376(+)